MGNVGSASSVRGSSTGIETSDSKTGEVGDKTFEAGDAALEPKAANCPPGQTTSTKTGVGSEAELVSVSQGQSLRHASNTDTAGPSTSRVNSMTASSAAPEVSFSIATSSHDTATQLDTQPRPKSDTAKSEAGDSNTSQKSLRDHIIDVWRKFAGTVRDIYDDICKWIANKVKKDNDNEGPVRVDGSTTLDAEVISDRLSESGQSTSTSNGTRTESPVGDAMMTMTETVIVPVAMSVLAGEVDKVLEPESSAGAVKQSGQIDSAEPENQNNGTPSIEIMSDGEIEELKGSKLNRKRLEVMLRKTFDLGKADFKVFLEYLSTSLNADEIYANLYNDKLEAGEAEALKSQVCNALNNLPFVKFDPELKAQEAANYLEKQFPKNTALIEAVECIRENRLDKLAVELPVFLFEKNFPVAAIISMSIFWDYKKPDYLLDLLIQAGLLETANA